jgi:hypothetical protein
MSSPPTAGKRSQLERVVLILIPIVGNVLLAAVLFARLPATLGTDGTGPTLLPSPSAVDRLPQSRLTSILAAVEGLTGHKYSCQAPWRASDGWSNWECRTDEAVVTVVGTDDQHIVRLDATWFGFDGATTDLPAWAAAVQRVPGRADASESWVAGELGGVASMEISTVRLAVGGARGALNLQIQAEAAGQ